METVNPRPCDCGGEDFKPSIEWPLGAIHFKTLLLPTPTTATTTTTTDTGRLKLPRFSVHVRKQENSTVRLSVAKCSYSLEVCVSLAKCTGFLNHIIFSLGVEGQVKQCLLVVFYTLATGKAGF